MKFRDVEKIYKINDNQEETAQDAVSSSASFGTKKTFAEMGKERERAVSARAGEIQRELKSFNEQYGALAEAFNSRTRTDDELRRDWEVLRPMGEALSEEIASSGLFDSESATGVRDALGEMISSFSEAVKPPKVPEYDIGSLGMLDELGERENARAAASRILALGATGEDAQKARDVLRQTDAPGTIDVGSHRLTVSSPKVPELITPKQVRGLSSAEEKLLEVQREDSSIPVGRSKNPIKNAVEKTNKATERAFAFNDRVAEVGDLIMDSTALGMDRALSNIADFAVGAYKGAKNAIVSPSAPELKGYSVPSEENPVGDTRKLNGDVVENTKNLSWNPIKNAKNLHGDLKSDVENFTKNFAKGQSGYLSSGDTFGDRTERGVLATTTSAQREAMNLNAVERVAANLAETIGYQLPNMVLTGATGASGIAANLMTVGTFGTGAYAEQKREALKAGYTEAEAELLARAGFVIEGVGETLLGDAFGTVPMLGRKLGFSIMSNVQNPIVRTMLSFMTESAEEGLEEVTQSFLSEAAHSLITGEDFKIDLQQVAYEGLLGALSGGLMGSVGLGQRIEGAKKVHAADVDYINSLSVNAEALSSAEEAREMIRALEKQRAALVRVEDSQSGIKDAADRAAYMDSMIRKIEVMLSEKYSLDESITDESGFERDKGNWFTNLKRSPLEGVSFQRSDDNAVIAIESRAAAVKDEAEARTVLDAIKGVREANALRGEIDAATVRESARMNERLSAVEEDLRARFGIEAPAEVSNDTEANTVTAESEGNLGTVDAVAEEESAPIEDEVELARAARDYVYDNTAAANETYNSAQLAGANPEQRAVAIELGQLFNKRVLFFSDPDRNVGGYYEPSENAIYVNVNSPRATYSIIASEMTHALERTPEYASIKKIVLKNFQEVERKSLDTLRKEKRKVYEAREGRKLSDEYIDQELCEEYIGKYLFSSSAHIQKFVRAAGVKSSNRFIQFFDGAIKAITRNNAVAKWIRTKLGDARMLWADAVNRVKSEGLTSGEEGRYSIDWTTSKRPVVVVNDDISRYTNNDKQLIKAVKTSIGRFKRVPIAKQNIHFTTDTKREVTYSEYTKWLRKNDRKKYLDKMRAFNHPQDIIYATTDYVNEGLKHPRSDNIVDFARGKILLDVGGRKYSAETVIGFTKKGICEIHDIVNIEPDSFEYKKEIPVSAISSKEERSQKGASLDTSIPQDDPRVNTKYTQNLEKDSSDRRNSYEGVDEIDENQGEESQEWEEDLAITERMRQNLEREEDLAITERMRWDLEREGRRAHRENKIRRGFVSMADQAIAEEEKRLKENEEARAPIEEYEPRYRGGYKVTAQEISEEEADMLRGQAMTEEDAAMSEEGYASGADRAIAEEEKRLAENEEARAPLDKLYPEMFQTTASDAEPPAPGTAAAVGEAAAKKVLPPEATPEEIAAAEKRLAKEAEAIKEALARVQNKSNLIYSGIDEAQALRSLSDYIAKLVDENDISAPMQVLAQEIADGDRDVTHIPDGVNKESVLSLASMYSAQKALVNQLPKNSALMQLGLDIVAPLVSDYRVAPALRGLERIRREAKKEVERLTSDLSEHEKDAAESIAYERSTLDNFTDKNFDRVKVSRAADAIRYLREYENTGVYAERANTVERFEEVLKTLVPSPEAATKKSTASLNFNTMVRNNLDVFGEVVGGRVNEFLFRPIVRNEGERMRFVNRENESFIRAFGKVTNKESEVVQMFIEAGIGVKEIAELEPEVLVERLKKISEDLNVDYQEYQKELEKKSVTKKDQKKLNRLRKDVRQASAKYEALSAAVENKLNVTRLANMADFFRAKYDLYYEAINDFLVVHGYEPIGFIKNYAPHMQEQNMERFSKILEKLGFKEGVFALPVEIAGRTEKFKPGKKYNPHFQTRHGIATDLNALAGFDSYVRHLSEVLYHTDDIQKLRQFNQYLRNEMSNAEIQKAIKGIRKKMRLGEIDEEKGNKDIEAELEKANNTNLSPYVDVLDNYTNLLAGKQSITDRSTERTLGREVLNFPKKIQLLFIQSSIVGNFSSAVNQTVQLPLVAAECGEDNLLKAFVDVASGDLNKKMEFDKKSTFITGKKGTTKLVNLDAYEKALEYGMIPFEVVDDVISRVIVRAKYYQLTGFGVSEDTALVLADEYAESAIGSRMKGAKPVIFHSKSPLYSLATTFQLEVANGWAHIIKDLPREFRNVERDRGRLSASGYLATFIIRYLIEAFVLNGLLDELYGQTPVQFDVIGYIVDGISAGFGLTRRGFIEALFTNALKGKEFDFLDAVAESGKEVMEDVPFLQTAMAILGYGDSRLPLPSIQTDKIIKGAQNISSDEKDVREKGWAQLLGGIWGTVKSFLPFGSQANKIWQGYIISKQGGSYDNSGRLQYAVGDGLSNELALIFGPQAFNENNEFWAAGGQALSKKATDAYEELRKSGMKFNEAYSLAKEMSALQGDEKPKKEIDVSGMDPFEAMTALYFTDYSDDEDEDLQTKVEKQVELLDSVEGLTDEQKYIAFKNLSADSKAADMMQYLAEHGVDYGEAYEVISSLAITKNTNDDPRAREEFLRKSDLTGWEKSFVYYNMLASKSEREAAEALRDLNEAEPVIYEVLDDISIEGSKGGTGVTERKRAIVMNSDLSDDGKLTMYSRMFVSDTESGKKEQALMNELVKSGVDSGIVADVFSGLKDEGTDAGKCNVLLESSLTNIEVEKVYLQRVVSDNDREKAQEKIDKVIDAGGNIRVYLKAYAAVSGLSWENGDWKKGESGGKSQAYKAAIDKVTSKVAIRRALYEVFGVSEKLW